MRRHPWITVLFLLILASVLVPFTAAGGETTPPPAELTRDYQYWRGRYEKTPGPFLCVKPDVTGVIVTCDRWPDTSDLRQFCLDAIRLSGAKTDHEKALAVWRWMRRVKSQTNGQAPTDPFNPERDGATVWDPIKIMNVYEAHWCSGLARVTALMWRSLGYEGHAVHRASHGLAGLCYEDFDGVRRPHLFDCNFGGFTLDRTGKRVLSMDEFSTDYYQWMHIWYYGEPWPMPTHRVDLAMRKGEGLKRIWGNWGKPCHDNVSAKKDLKTRKPFEKGPYPVTFGNGLWTYAPDLSSADWTKGLAEPLQNCAAGKLQPAAAGKPASATWHFRTPYIAVESEIEIKAFRKSDADTLKLSLSVDGGKNWKPCWSAPAEKTGEQTFTAKLDQKFKIAPGKWKVPADFNSPFGRYAFRLKLDMLAKESPADCEVKGITFKTTVQQAIRSLPQLWPGRNTITVKGKLKKDAAIKVTYIWDDPKGKARKNVTIAEALPYSYEIIAAGAKWEDCVCKDILIEAVPATGKGSQTILKEKPSEIQKLPPEPSVAESRCRWMRELHRDKQKPSVQDIIKQMEAGRTSKKILVWASELADPAAFEAVKKVAYDKTICSKAGNKEVALLALYNTDREKARPVLLHMAADVKNSPWRGGDDMKYAGGAWMSGACIIGQMAAESGWKEFVPVLARALGSEYCKSSRSRMSILRSMSVLVKQPGDKEAIAAVRKCLTLEEAYMLPQAALVAGKLGDKGSIPRLRELLDHPFMVVRRRAAIALGMLGDTESAPKLRESIFRIRKREVLDHIKYGTQLWFDENMRAAAAEGLGLMKDKGSLPHLEKALAGEPVPWVRKKIEKAIAILKEGGQ